MIIEICANSYQSAYNAAIAEADRIELCSELEVGGITPSYGLIKQVAENLTIPFFVLIRPRSGNFIYSENEFEIMKKDIEISKGLGCSGIVSGILKENNTIDIERTKELIAVSKPLPFTFHRAFDWAVDPFKTMIILAELGVCNILTSGQKPTAFEGIDLLRQLKEKANDKITIMPGGGINEQNIISFKNAGFTEIHFSATKLTQDSNTVKVPTNSVRFFNETQTVISDKDKIIKIINLVK